MDHDHQNQSNVVSEMFDVANVAQPAAPQRETRSFTADNIQVPEPKPQITTANNGFTVDDIQQPMPASEPIQEGDQDD